MPDAHSLLVGGSVASRRIHCPASFQESLRAPQDGTPSIYAEHGTALHEAIAYRLKNPSKPIIGQVFNNHAVTEQDFNELLIPADLALDELQALYGEMEIVAEELRVQIPFIPGAFGTVDLILQSKTHFVICDYKFGSGVQVFCTAPDGELNPQLLFYLLGCRHLVPANRKLVIAIVQPAFTPALAHATVTPEYLNAFATTLTKAIVNAVSANPRRARGEWCRFAPCKLTCPAWTGPLLDLTALGRPPSKEVQPANKAWGEFLSRAKHLVDSAVMYQKDIDNALIEHLRAGGKAPGFALKPAVKNRKWLDDVDEVAKQLKKLGLTQDQIWQRRLQTFTVTDAAAKRLGKTIPDSLRPKPPSTDLVLTAEDDPAAISMGVRQEKFAAALAKLK